MIQNTDIFKFSTNDLDKNLKYKYFIPSHFTLFQQTLIVVSQLKAMEGKHKSAVGEVADHLEQCRRLQKALGESEEKRAVAEKSGKLSTTTLDTIRSVR